MSLMGKIETRELQWYAVRVKEPKNRGRRAIVLGGEFETYRNRQGRVCKRRKPDTGTRVFVAEHLLRRRGFEVFMPVKMDWHLKNRFTKDRHFVASPLLVGWMFVGWPVGENRWHDLMAMDVVTGVFGTGGRLVSISEAQIIRLMRRWGGGVMSPEMTRYSKCDLKFKPGDRVRVVENHPLDGHEITVIDVSAGSVNALVNLLGKDVEWQIGSHLLEAVPTETCS